MLSLISTKPSNLISLRPQDQTKKKISKIEKKKPVKKPDVKNKERDKYV